MSTRGELKQIAKTRLKEAKALFEKGLYDGSCYLAGYVVELALKARICKTLNIDEYPDSGEVTTHLLVVRHEAKLRAVLPTNGTPLRYVPDYKPLFDRR